MLPLYIDFIESPVPLLTGLVVDADEDKLSPEILLSRCDDDYCSGIAAVLDTTLCEIYMLSYLLVPEGESLMESLKEGMIAAEMSSRLSC